LNLIHQKLHIGARNCGTLGNIDPIETHAHRLIGPVINQLQIATSKVRTPSGGFFGVIRTRGDSSFGERLPVIASDLDVHVVAANQFTIIRYQTQYVVPDRRKGGGRV
jgi:hypothetical protein